MQFGHEQLVSYEASRWETVLGDCGNQELFTATTITTTTTTTREMGNPNSRTHGMDAHS